MIRRVLVTGSNGLLGQKLTRIIENDPHFFLIATGKRGSVLPIQRGEYHHLDITDDHAVHNLIASTSPDVVIHTAAMTNVDQCEQDKEGCLRVNVEGTRSLVSACLHKNIHFIHLSTDFVFDGTAGPLDESAVPAPVNFYGESKLAAEEIVRESPLDWSIIRTVLVYGITRDMSRSNIVLWVKSNLEKGNPINVVNDQWRTPTLAEDLAKGCYLAAAKRASGIYHISGYDYLTPYDIAIRTAEFFNLDKDLITPVTSAFLVQPARRPLKTGFVISKARKDLGYEPHSFEEGIQVLVNQTNDPASA